MIPVGEVTRILDCLPKRPRQIAKFFRKQGIKGLRGSYYECPLAVYLQSIFPAHKIEVLHDGVFIDTKKVLNIPKHVSDFTRLFDIGHYKYLRRKS